ncbi:hypothetical protein C8R45DRAFT_1043361 [Mycena sanguinolenta]|nr:hypothetical protein C8R45DRAFT_1043361 [Mycena sanguinolenta]
MHSRPRLHFLGSGLLYRGTRDCCYTVVLEVVREELRDGHQATQDADLAPCGTPYPPTARVSSSAGPVHRCAHSQAAGQWPLSSSTQGQLATPSRQLSAVEPAQATVRRLDPSTLCRCAQHLRAAAETSPQQMGRLQICARSFPHDLSSGRQIVILGKRHLKTLVRAYTTPQQCEVYIRSSQQHTCDVPREKCSPIGNAELVVNTEAHRKQHILVSSGLNLVEYDDRAEKAYNPSSATGDSSKRT